MAYKLSYLQAKDSMLGIALALVATVKRLGGIFWNTQGSAEGTRSTFSWTLLPLFAGMSFRGTENAAQILRTGLYMKPIMPL